MNYPFRVSILEAAYHVELYQSENRNKTLEETIQHLREGPADVAGLDYMSLSEFYAAFGSFGVVASQGRYKFYRQALAKLIRTLRPPWLSSVLLGRRRLLERLSLTERQCLAEAQLLTDHADADAIRWWDDLASELRAINQQVALKVGREGEDLSVYFETCRVGERPEWTALEDNGAGYDIKSKVAVDETSPLYIEVKATRARPMVFHLSRGEWDFAENARASYVLHLWVLSELRVRVVRFEELSGHIPDDKGDGEWQDVQIQFPDDDLWQVAPAR